MPDIDFNIVIPARFASSRLPGKPLKDILGKPMVQHVYERALKAGASEVIIATDHADIAMAAKAFGAEVIMTKSTHENGTERLAEVSQLKGWGDDTLVVNVQGDEPLIPVELITQVAENLAKHPEAGIASLASVIQDPEECFNPNAVKVVLDHQGFALYFSRAPIPWARDTYSIDRSHNLKQALPLDPSVLRHIGMYAYRAGFLHQYTSDMPTTALEQVEALEQLRALYYGVKIHMGVIDTPPPAGVDTEDDLRRVIQILS